jgi:hypothetical protein
MLNVYQNRFELHIYKITLILQFLHKRNYWLWEFGIYSLIIILVNRLRLKLTWRIYMKYPLVTNSYYFDWIYYLRFFFYSIRYFQLHSRGQIRFVKELALIYFYLNQFWGYLKPGHHIHILHYVTWKYQLFLYTKLKLILEFIAVCLRSSREGSTSSI